MANVMVALDRSTSMTATDVIPTRISALTAAASRFVHEVPRSFRLGVVHFADSARLDVAPTTDRTIVLQATQKTDLDAGTAIGEAIYTSLDTLT
jgi:Ca-activated chloride channel family protein